MTDSNGRDRSDYVREIRFYGLVLIAAGVALGAVLLVLPPLVLGLALVVFSPLMWYVHRKYQPVFNLGPPAGLIGVLFLLTDSESGVLFADISEFEVAAFVAITGVIELIIAPFLARLYDR